MSEHAGGVNEIDKRIIIIPFELLNRIAVKSPSKYYVIDALGNKVFFKTNKKVTAQQLCDEYFKVKGKYTVLVEGVPTGDRSNITAK